ncbi:MAG: aldolase [Proteobacteria bacterium]|nr:MAG: aldolase [Pseudomonadota bacterium]
MSDSQEGVIKYQLDFRQEKLPETIRLDQLELCRSKLIRLGMLGQDDARYEGYGFGNISARYTSVIDPANPLPANRLPGSPDAFLITGSQTGHLDSLSCDEYVLVEHFDENANSLRACGMVKPSSESLSHGVVYRTKAEVNAVIHVHDPELWSNAEALQFPVIPSNIPYGTVEMAKAIAGLLLTLYSNRNAGVFVMAGHEDGVIAFGPDVPAAMALLADKKQIKNN